MAQIAYIPSLNGGGLMLKMLTKDEMDTYGASTREDLH